MNNLKILFAILFLLQLGLSPVAAEQKSKDQRRYTMGDLMKAEKKKRKPTWQERTERLLVTVAHIGLFILHPHVVFSSRRSRPSKKQHNL